MDAVDGSVHYELSSAEEPPSLLAIVLDTNPRAWAALANTLPLSKALANILVFANSHLALSSTNQVAVIASHCNRAVWLYPTPAATAAAKKSASSSSRRPASDDNIDVDMDDGGPQNGASAHANGRGARSSANKFPQFREVETALLQSVHQLVTSTTERDLDETTTLLSGALTLALAHIHKTAILIPAAAAAAAAADGKKPGARTSQSGGGSGPDGAAGKASGSHSGGDKAGSGSGSGGGAGGGGADEVGLHARILVISVSDSSPAQYIPTMNAVFAAAHAGVAIDVLALRGAATFLQQAAYITRGTFVAAHDAAATASAAEDTTTTTTTRRTQGLLAYLMLAFSAGGARESGRCLIAPSADAVDFRAACFCHRRVVDTGFVCSICLSIFCEVPTSPDGDGTAECLTCGSRLRLGTYGAKPAVIPRPKKKKKKRLPGAGAAREGTASTVGTPMAS